MNEEHILYILVFKSKKYIKIGITERVRFKNRLSELVKDFGEINYDRSLYFSSSSYKSIKQTEKSLHLLFWEQSKHYSKGSGKTEFFHEKTFKYTIKILTSSKSILKLNGPFYFKQKKSFYLLYFIGIFSISTIAFLSKINF